MPGSGNQLILMSFDVLVRNGATDSITPSWVYSCHSARGRKHGHEGRLETSDFQEHVILDFHLASSSCVLTPMRGTSLVD